MVLSELGIELASPEACFQAASKEECFLELLTWRNKMHDTTRPMTILSAVETFADSNAVPNGILASVAHLSVFNMFTIIHALYLQVYRLETAGSRLLNAAEIQHIARALHRWKELWPSQSRDEEMVKLAEKDCDPWTSWRSIGFIRHAPEYWLLAHLTLEKLKNRFEAHTGRVCARTVVCEDDDMQETKALLAQFKSGGVGMQSISERS